MSYCQDCANLTRELATARRDAERHEGVSQGLAASHASLRAEVARLQGALEAVRKLLETAPVTYTKAEYPGKYYCGLCGFVIDTHCDVVAACGGYWIRRALVALDRPPGADPTSTPDKKEIGFMETEYVEPSRPKESPGESLRVEAGASSSGLDAKTVEACARAVEFPGGPIAREAAAVIRALGAVAATAPPGPSSRRPAREDAVDLLRAANKGNACLCGPGIADVREVALTARPEGDPCWWCRVRAFIADVDASQSEADRLTRAPTPLDTAAKETT